MDNSLFVRKSFSQGVFWPVVGLMGVMYVFQVGAGLLFVKICPETAEGILYSANGWNIMSSISVFFTRTLVPVLLFQGVMKWLNAFAERSSRGYRIVISWESAVIMYIVLLMCSGVESGIMRNISSAHYGSIWERSIIPVMLTFLVPMLAFWLVSLLGRSGKYNFDAFPYGLQKREKP